MIDYEADLKVLRDEKQPFSVGDADPELREREAFGVVASSYEPIETRFNAFKAPESGRYKLRFKGYTFWAGGEEKKWWRPDREKLSRGRRSEPVAIYSVAPPRQLRKLGEFDFEIEPSIRELDVYLLEGESIQTDAVRLFRSRPSNWHNPLAEEDGMPGVAYNYMEAEGPIYDQWPTRGAQLMFSNLPLVKSKRGAAVESQDPINDARRLMMNFVSEVYHRPVEAVDVERFVSVVEFAMAEKLPFEDAMIAWLYGCSVFTLNSSACESPSVNLMTLLSPPDSVCSCGIVNPIKRFASSRPTAACAIKRSSSNRSSDCLPMIVRISSLTPSWLIGWTFERSMTRPPTS